MDVDDGPEGDGPRNERVPRLPPGPARQPTGGCSPLGGPQPVFSPTLAEVLERSVGTVRHIPAACRLQVASELGGILSRLVQTPTWEEIYRLLAFPKMVLTTGPRGCAAPTGHG